MWYGVKMVKEEGDLSWFWKTVDNSYLMEKAITVNYVFLQVKHI